MAHSSNVQSGRIYLKWIFFLYILLVIDSDVDSLNPSGSGRYAKSRE